MEVVLALLKVAIGRKGCLGTEKLGFSWLLIIPPVWGPGGCFLHRVDVAFVAFEKNQPELQTSQRKPKQTPKSCVEAQKGGCSGVTQENPNISPTSEIQPGTPEQRVRINVDLKPKNHPQNPQNCPHWRRSVIPLFPSGISTLSTSKKNPKTPPEEES